jgi:transposase
MRTGRPKQTLELSAEEIVNLRLLARRPKSAQAAALRARIVLGCAQGLSNAEVASELNITPATVCKWRQRFLQNRITGLSDGHRPGAPRKISDERIEEVITQTLEAMVEPSMRWSTRRLAEKTGLSQSAIVRIWRAFGLQPHHGEGLRLSNEPRIVENVRAVVGLYMNPPDRAVALCVDGKGGQSQAQESTQPALPPEPAASSRDCEPRDIRQLLGALNDATREIASAHLRRKHEEFLAFLRKVDAVVAFDHEVHLVMDNYGAHRMVQVRRWLARRQRFHVHFKPTNAIWLNLVERLFSEVSDRGASHASSAVLKDLGQAMLDYLNSPHKDLRHFAWTADQASLLVCGTTSCTNF